MDGGRPRAGEVGDNTTATDTEKLEADNDPPPTAAFYPNEVNHLFLHLTYPQYTHG